MASLQRLQLKLLACALLLIPTAAAKSQKPNSRPVHEVINEQARMDERPRNLAGNLPYGNPLAGNSQQNARLHAQNQQAMFNAERVRQHRAQLQRWTKAPMDSYMKAFHESQESHHIALEQQQNQPMENIQEQSKTKTTPRIRARTPRPEQTRNTKAVQLPELTKITKEDAMERNRNHRSHGSANYHQYLQPKYLQNKKYQTVYLSPGPTYDQGVTIKPNGNIGLTHLNNQEETIKLYTEAVASKANYIHPKQYTHYQSSQDIDALNSILKKSPNDQLTELNALLNSEKGHENNQGGLETPIDLYFYMKPSPVQSLAQHYDHAQYAQIPPTYASAYMPEVKDHTPITEEVDDIEDPNRHTRPKSFPLQPATPSPESETTTTKSNNYYKVEVASQIISAAYKQPHQPQQIHYVHQEEEQRPSYQSLQYEEQKPAYQSVHYDDKPAVSTSHFQNLQDHEPVYFTPENQKPDDDSERYLHHNAQHVGVQHLNEDGTGVSAYGDDDLHYAANYEFGYRVRDRKSGNAFGHHEAKRGGKTNGHYHVLLPDGRMQQVKYSAGPDGFHADISYDHLQE